MSHITARSAYEKLAHRLDRMPQGAPPSETLYQILKMLFTEKEAERVAQLPIRPITIPAAAKIWGVSHLEAEKTLNGLAARAVLIDIETDQGMRYALPPPMAGFFEFSMMRLRGDINQEVLGQLYHQYLNVEEDFVKQLFTGSETQIIRTYVQEPMLTSDQMVEVLDFEKASHYIKTEKHMGISMCYCRHKMSHTPQGACDAPMDICMTFGTVADSLIRHGYARRVDPVEGMELLHQAYDNNLVQCGENVQQNIGYICNCCGCCCEALLAAKRFANLHPVATTNYLAQITEDCVNCGKCVSVCPINAIEGDKSQTNVLTDLCLGCGVCVRTCPKNALHLTKRDQSIITPTTSVHRTVLMAIEKGMLQNLIFENDALYSHRAMAAILSAILNLSPVQKAIASDQFRSVYLQKLIQRFK